MTLYFSHSVPMTDLGSIIHPLPFQVLPLSQREKVNENTNTHFVPQRQVKKPNENAITHFVPLRQGGE